MPPPSPSAPATPRRPLEPGRQRRAPARDAEHLPGVAQCGQRIGEVDRRRAGLLRQLRRPRRAPAACAGSGGVAGRAGAAARSGAACCRPGPRRERCRCRCLRAVVDDDGELVAHKPSARCRTKSPTSRATSCTWGRGAGRSRRWSSLSARRRRTERPVRPRPPRSGPAGAGIDPPRGADVLRRGRERARAMSARAAAQDRPRRQRSGEPAPRVQPAAPRPPRPGFVGDEAAARELAEDGLVGAGNAARRIDVPMRTSQVPLMGAASSQLASAATSEPACSGPVGDGAKRPR